MNRVGIMVDISHPSKGPKMQAIALSKAPVIASHSGARALCDHSRNMDDELLLALKKNGGVVQTVAFAGYVKTRRRRAGAPGGAGQARTGVRPAGRQHSDAADAVARRGRRGRGSRGAPAALAPPRRAQQRARPWRSRQPAGAADRRQAGRPQKRLAEIDKKFPPPPRANVKDFVDHIDYIVKKIGIDHVGISSDFDGGGGIDGWNDASETFNVTLELVRRGYTEEQIAKIWSGNLLRVMDEVRKVAAHSEEALLWLGSRR